MDVRNILYATDFSPSAELAFAHATDFARRLGARLHMLHVVALHSDVPYDPMFYSPATDEAYARAEMTALRGLQELAASPAATGVDVLPVVLRSPFPGTAIVEYAQRNASDLVVMGTHGRRGPSRLLLGSRAEEVLRHAPCPVLTLRDAEDGRVAKRAVPPRCILVPFDFAPPSRKALSTAAALARHCGARLRLLHVMDELPLVDVAGGVAVVEASAEREQRLARLRLRLNDVVAYLASDVGTTIDLRVGRPAAEILRASEEPSVDLVVMATRAETGIKRVLFGSIAEEVMRLVSAPLLIVKPGPVYAAATVPATSTARAAPPAMW
jgi:nucleotide-binding universal stress UspA family protein